VIPLEVIKNQIKFFIERGNYMKKVICLFSAFLLLLSSAMTTYAHEADSQDYLSIPSYNETYSEQPTDAPEADSQDYLSIPSYNETYSGQPTDNDFLSLQEYNAEYSNGENPLEQPTDNDFLSLQEYNNEYSNGENPLEIDSPLTTQNDPDICAISPIRKQTKSIILANQKVKVGTITLQYQTDIKGGRPQFLYDTCYLGHPNITTYWKLETSNVKFSGDRISVYLSFTYGSFQDHAWVYFYPN
jgi:hypothetical protein